MDRIRKSVVERHITLLIVIHSASGFALACLYGFLIARQDNCMENHILHRNKNYVKLSLTASGLYDEKYLLRYA
jgi:hypothetical protein